MWLLNARPFTYDEKVQLDVVGRQETAYPVAVLLHLGKDRPLNVVVARGAVYDGGWVP